MGAPCRLVVIGGSRGGLDALRVLLGALPAHFPAAVAVVLHRGAAVRPGLAEALSRSAAVPVLEPEDKTPMEAGRIYVAPGDYHLLVERGWLALSTDPPVNGARPSVDVLFETAADAFRDGVAGVLLSGGGRDGARGLEAIVRRGGVAMVQDPATAEAPSMASTALSVPGSGGIQVLSLEQIGAGLRRLATGVRS